MKSDLNIDCPLSFSILLDEELEQYKFPTKQKEKLHDLLMLVFKEGMRC